MTATHSNTRLASPLKPPSETPNIGAMLLDNQRSRGQAPAVAERRDGSYRYWSWHDFVNDTLKVADYLLQHLPERDEANRVAFVSVNGYQRLVCEMAVMASGLTSVPIFVAYPSELMSELLSFSDTDLLVTDQLEKISELPEGSLPPRVLAIGEVDKRRLTSFSSLGVEAEWIEEILAGEMPRDTSLPSRFRAVPIDRRALIMYTSGTSSFPKGVQLSHRNLMSQQQALEQLWRPEPGLRFLCYLPWHHSFGGLFERLLALFSGGCLAIDDSFGKDVDRLLENFAKIKPHIYFSVPKIYQEIIARVVSRHPSADCFFHPELKFVFTAAAPLPISASNVFKENGLPVVEGWGLTETSPCCTLTELATDRQAGVVGMPIPGVELKMADDGEILVKGPNVMSGYFKRPDKTAEVFDDDGWFHTGDVGAITDDGLKIISRKEWMFKLDNGEKVFPTQIESCVTSRCNLIKYAYVFGAGQKNPGLLVFPNLEMLGMSSETSDTNCSYPPNLKAFSHCLGECIAQAQKKRGVNFERISKALVIARELSLESNELTPSFKLIPRAIEARYRTYIDAVLNGSFSTLPDDAYVIDFPNPGSHTASKRG